MSAHPTGTPAPIAVLSDLIFGARIRAAAAASGIPVALSLIPDRIVEAVRDGARAAFIDLDTRATDPVAVIARIRADPASASTPIVAFASHVRTDLIEAARAAGANRVLARGAFARLLPSLLLDSGADG